MTISNFNTKSGIYCFHECGLVTDFHAHPSLEIIIAKSGLFSLETPSQKLENINAALVRANQTHRFLGAAADCMIMMVEEEKLVLPQLLELLDETGSSTPIWPIAEKHLNGFGIEQLEEWYNSADRSRQLDDRVLTAKHCIHQLIAEVSPVTLAEVAQEVKLSPSRLSHLFKAEVGVSIQEYIIWCRLKFAVSYLLSSGGNLQEATHTAGFYDASHFSRQFKKFFGIAPSTVYNNSRIVQGLG